MKIKIIEQKENPLFKRKEIVLEITSKISPTNVEVLKLISENFSVPEENIKLKGIYGNFGAHVFSVYANVYNSISDKESTEVKTKKEKEAEKKVAEEKMKAEAEEKMKTAEPKKPAEEIKEEIKAEEKKE